MLKNLGRGARKHGRACGGAAEKADNEERDRTGELHDTKIAKN